MHDPIPENGSEKFASGWQQPGRPCAPSVNFYFMRSNSTRSMPRGKPARPISRARRMRAGGEPVSGVAEQKFRRFENTHQRLGPKTGLKTASTRPLKGAETLSGRASL